MLQKRRYFALQYDPGDIPLPVPRRARHTPPSVPAQPAGTARIQLNF